MNEDRLKGTELVPYDVGELGYYEEPETVEGEYREMPEPEPTREAPNYEPPRYERPRYSRESQRIEDELGEFYASEEPKQAPRDEEGTSETDEESETANEESTEDGTFGEKVAYISELKRRGFTYDQAKELADEAFPSQAQEQADYLRTLKLSQERAKLEQESERIRILRQTKGKNAKETKFDPKKLKNILTLGGPIKANKRTRDLYLATGLHPLGATNRNLYDISGMRKLTAPSGLASIHQAGNLAKLRGATMPQPLKNGTNLGLRRPSVDLSQLREAGRLSGSPFKVNLNFNTLRQMSVPRGWSRAEAMAYQEILENHDIDTRSHVVSELMALGVSKAEASKAISSLLRRRVIKHGGRFSGEPVLEVVKR